MCLMLIATIIGKLELKDGESIKIKTEVTNFMLVRFSAYRYCFLRTKERMHIKSEIDMYGGLIILSLTVVLECSIIKCKSLCLTI